MLPTMRLNIPCAPGDAAVSVLLPTMQCGSPPRVNGRSLCDYSKLPTPPRSNSLESSPSRNSCTPSTPDSAQPSTSHRRNSDASSAQHRRRRGSDASDLVFSRRAYEELYRERAYLSSALQTQTNRTTNLQWQYTRVREQLEVAVAGGSNKERRRLRKQLSFLRSKLNDAAGQKKALVVRLSEVYIEIQSHETWSLAELDRMSRHGTPTTEVGNCYFTLSTPVACESVPHTPLNAASPEFMPRRFAPWNAPDSWPMDKAGRSNSLGGMAELARVDEGDEDFMCNHDLKYRYHGCDEDLSDSPVPERRMSSGGDFLKNERERRLSLPTLETLWP